MMSIKYLAPSRRRFLVGASALTMAGVVAGCASEPNYAAFPIADQVVVTKSTRSMVLAAQGKIIRKYRVNLGFAPNGTKLVQGDGRTPVGRYFVDRRNPRSAFHLSLGINYPNRDDVARARAMGIDPGNDIFIHGSPRRVADQSKPDWTAGCIAVSDREIEEIWHMVALGTPVTILA